MHIGKSISNYFDRCSCQYSNNDDPSSYSIFHKIYNALFLGVSKFIDYHNIYCNKCKPNFHQNVKLVQIYLDHLISLVFGICLHFKLNLTAKYHLIILGSKNFNQFKYVQDLCIMT